jgi:hypothetical protein
MGNLLYSCVYSIEPPFSFITARHGDNALRVFNCKQLSCAAIKESRIRSLMTRRRASRRLATGKKPRPSRS